MHYRDSFFADSVRSHPNPSWLDFHTDKTATQSKCGDRASTTPCEWVEDEVAFVGGGAEDAVEQSQWLLRGVLAEALFHGFGRADVSPNALHLFAAGFLAHGLIVEFVLALEVPGRPDDGFGGVGEVTAGKIGRRIGFDPGNVIEQLEAELLHGEADGMDHVAGAADPNGSIGLEDALAGFEPQAIEFVIGVGAARAVPGTFVDADHASGVAGDAAVGKEVGRIGEDEVHARGGKRGEDFQAIGLVDGEVMFGIVEGGGGQGVREGDRAVVGRRLDGPWFCAKNGSDR